MVDRGALGCAAAVLAIAAVPLFSQCKETREPAPTRKAPPAEAVPEGHEQAVEAAEKATEALGASWLELRRLRLCLSDSDVELREFRDRYNRSLVDGVPARPVDMGYRISRDHLQACDRSLSDIEGDGAIAAAAYRRMIAAILPPILVLRDYHREKDYLEDGFARAREQHPAVIAALEQLDQASSALRARATAVRAEIAAALPPGPRDLDVELYFRLLALDDLLTAGADAAAIDGSFAELEEVREKARAVVADLAGSKKADRIDNALQATSAVMAGIKNKRRRRAGEPDTPLGPNSLRPVEYDFFRFRR